MQKNVSMFSQCLHQGNTRLLRAIVQGLKSCVDRSASAWIWWIMVE